VGISQLYIGPFIGCISLYVHQKCNATLKAVIVGYTNHNTPDIYVMGDQTTPKYLYYKKSKLIQSTS